VTTPPAWQQRAVETRRLSPAWMLAAGLILLSGLALLFAVHQRYERPPRDTAPLGTWSNPPDTLSPVLAGTLVTNGTPQLEHAMAAIFSLADRGELADERIGVRHAALVRARDVGEAAVRDVLQAPRDAGRAMILHVRDVDDLCEPLRHEPHHVRARVFFAEKIGFEVRLGIVAAVVGVPVGAFSRDDFKSLGQTRRVIHLGELILKALVQIDLRHRHPDSHELPDCLGDDLVSGHAVRIPPTVDFDADDV